MVKSVKKRTPKKREAKKPTVKTKASTTSSKETSSSADQIPVPQPGPIEVLGQVTWLMMQSPLHKHFFFADAEWLVLPPVKLQQFRIFRKNNLPIAFASWARLTEEAETRFVAGEVRLQPTEWNAGDKLWLVDLVAPFGGGEEIIKQLREQVFKDEKVKSLQPAPDGSGMDVVEF